MTYDPGLKYELSDCLTEAAIARNPDVLRWTRERLAADMDDYPGVVVWTEEIADGIRRVTLTKYPAELAARIIERRLREALHREEDAA